MFSCRIMSCSKRKVAKRTSSGSRSGNRKGDLSKSSKGRCAKSSSRHSSQRSRLAAALVVDKAQPASSCRVISARSSSARTRRASRRFSVTILIRCLPCSSHCRTWRSIALASSSALWAMNTLRRDASGLLACRCREDCERARRLPAVSSNNQVRVTL